MGTTQNTAATYARVDRRPPSPLSPWGKPCRLPPVRRRRCWVALLAVYWSCPTRRVKTTTNPAIPRALRNALAPSKVS